jgi:hypothetical protein
MIRKNPQMDVSESSNQMSMHSSMLEKENSNVNNTFDMIMSGQQEPEVKGFNLEVRGSGSSNKKPKRMGSLTKKGFSGLSNQYASGNINFKKGL